MTTSTEVSYRIQFEQQTTADHLSYSTMPAVMQSIQRFRALADPAYVPVGVLEVITNTTVETVIRMVPLGRRDEDVIEEVRKQFVALDPMPQGSSALEWAVRQTIKEVGHG